MVDPFKVGWETAVPVAQATPVTPDAYTSLDYNEIKNNPQFLEDLRTHYGQEAGTNDPDKLIDTFFRDRLKSDLNSVSLGEDVYAAYSADTEGRERMKRLQAVYDKSPLFFRDDFGRFGQAADTIVGSTLTDPVNYIGFGFGGIAAREVAKAGVRAGLKSSTILARSALAGARRGAISEAAVNAPIEAAFDAATQARDIKLGLLKEYDAGRTGKAAALGALGGAALGGVFGAAGGGFVGARVARAGGSGTIGTTTTERAPAPEDELMAERDEEFDSAAQADLFPDEPRIEPEPSSEQEIDRVLNYRIEQLRAQLARAQRDGEDTSSINKALTAARSLQIKRKTLDERMAAAEQQLASSDPAEIKKGERALPALEEEQASIKALTVEDIDARTEVNEGQPDLFLGGQAAPDVQRVPEAEDTVPAPEEAPAAPEPEAPAAPEAVPDPIDDLVENARAGMPAFITNAMRAAARKVGVEIEQTDTPTDVVDKIAAKREESDAVPEPVLADADDLRELLADELEIPEFLDRRGETAATTDPSYGRVLAGEMEAPEWQEANNAVALRRTENNQFVPDESGDFENAEFWGVPTGDGNYSVYPGKKQQRDAAMFIANDGSLGENFYRGSFEIDGGDNFGVARPASGTQSPDGTITISRAGQIQLPGLERRAETAEDIIDDVERGNATTEQAAERLEAIDVDPADVGGEVLDAAARANAQRALDELDVDEAVPLIKESQQAIADKIGTVTQARKIINAAAGGKKLPKAERQQLAAQVARVVNQVESDFVTELEAIYDASPDLILDEVFIERLIEDMPQLKRFDDNIDRKDIARRLYKKFKSTDTQQSLFDPETELSEVEQTEFTRRMANMRRQIVKEFPDAPEAFVELRLRNASDDLVEDIIRRRRTATDTSSPLGRIDDTMPVVAGRTVERVISRGAATPENVGGQQRAGRVQGFLRKSNKQGIVGQLDTGKTGKKARFPSLREIVADLEIQESRRATQMRGLTADKIDEKIASGEIADIDFSPRPFTASARTRVVDGAPLKRGEEGVYDPVHKRAYRHRVNMEKDRDGLASGRIAPVKPINAKPDPEQPEPAKPEYVKEAPPEPDITEPTSVPELAVAYKNGELTLEEFLARAGLDQKKPDPAPEAAAPEVAPAEQPRKAPSSADEFINAANAVNIPEGEILAVRLLEDTSEVRLPSARQIAGTGSYGEALAKVLGKKSPDNFELVTVPAGTRSKSISAAENAQPIDVAAPRPERASATKRELPPFLPDIQNARVVLPELSVDPGGEVSVREAHTILMNLHSVNWSDIDDLGPIIDDIVAVEKALADQNIVYRLPNADRQTAIKNVENIFSGVSTEDAVSARDFLRRLGGNRNEAPRILQKSPDAREGQGAFKPVTNELELRPGDAAFEITPPVAKLYHEVAHWSYMNVLTSDDRITFLSYIKGRMDGGETPQEIVGDVYLSNTGLSGNYDLNPQEFFANSFEQWVMGNKSPEIETLMQRVSEIIRAAIDFFITKSPIVDPELDMLFRKILPDEFQGEIDLPSEDIVKQAANPGAQLAAGKLFQLDDARRSIHEAIESQDPMRMREVANDAAREALGLSRLKMLTQRTFKAADGSIRRSKTGGRLRALAMRGFEATQDKESFEDASLFKDADNYDYDEFDSFEEGYDFFDGANEAFGELEDSGFSVSDIPAEYTGEVVNSVEILDVLNRLDEEFRLAQRDLSQVFFGMEKKNIDGLRNPFTRYAPYEPPQVRKAKGKAKARRQRKENKALEEASSKKKPEARSTPDDAAKSPRAMSARELAEKYNSMEPSTERTRIAKEIKRMAAAEPEVSGVKISKEIKRLRIDDLTDLVQNGTVKQSAQALAELARRSDGKVPSYAFKKAAQPEVRGAISREVEDTTGTTSDTNPFPAARSQLRNILEQMTHRDAETDSVMKTVTYRLFNLSGLNVHGSPEDLNVISDENIGNILGDLSGTAPDSTPSGDTIRKLQKEMRRLASSIQRMNAGENVTDGVIDDIINMVVRSPAVSDAARETFADFDEVGRSIIEGLPENAPMQNQVFAAAVREQVAYVLNGLITGPQARNKLSLLTHYGDMFADMAPEKSVHDMFFHSRTAPASVAADYFKQAVEKMSIGRAAAMHRFIRGHGKHADGSPRAFYHATPNGIALGADKNPILKPSETGQQGDGIYLSTNPNIVQEVYANRPTLGALRQMFNADEIAGVDELIEQRMTMVEDIRYLNEMIVTQERNVSPMDMLGDAGDIQMGVNKELIQDLKNDLEGRADLLEFIDDELEALTGTRVSPDVLPVVVSAQKSFNAHSKSIYAKDDQEILDIIDEVANTPGIDVDAVDSFYARLPETFSGDDFYGGTATNFRGEAVEMDGVINLLARLAGETEASGVTRNDFNEILRRLGYDSIYTETTNKSDNLLPVSHDTLVVFDSNNVKHIDAENFDGDEPYLYKSNIEAPEFFPSAGVMNGAMETTGMPDYRGAGTTWASAIEESGHPASVSKAMQQMLAGRIPDDADAQPLFKQMLPQIRTNARRLRDSGAHWIADFLQPNSGAGMFEKLDVATARTLMPIYKVLNDLPGANNAAKRFVRNTNPFKKPIPAHVEIVSAIRRGDPSSLSPEQKVAYDALKGAFEQTMLRMRDAGIIVGDVGPNYFPQVYDVDMIARKKDGFIRAMGKYFKREGDLEGRPITEDEAEDIASRVFKKLTDDEGVYMPPRAETAGENADHIDHNRLIQLHKVDADGKLIYENELNDIEEFLVNDPETIIGKYHLASERRIMLTERFGVNMHGFKDYLALAAHGPDALTKLLSTDKVITIRNSVIGEEGPQTVGEQVILARKPFPNEQAAAQMSSELIALARQGKHDDVARLLDDLKPDAGSSWQKRSEAIKQALKDFGGRRQGMHQSEIEFMEQTFRLMNNKPAPGNAGMYAFSKNAKALGNIMYLGFTTLTSTTDVVLPLLRSGQFGSWVKGLARYATDPNHRDAMKNSGMTMGNILHGHLANLYGSQSGKFSTAFFNATGLTPWTNVMRNVAGSVALEFLRAEARTMHSRAGRPNRAYRMAKKRLEHYGLSEYGDPNAPISLDSPEALNDPKVSEALVKFAGETIFAPNRNDIPLWAQTPVGELMFHLKSFPLMMGRLSRNIMEDAYTYVRTAGKDGDIKPLFFMMTAAPAMGTGTLGLKDLIQSRGGDDERSPEFRERTFEKLAANFGFESKVRGKISTPFGDAPADEFLGWYLEGMLQLGGLGLIAELMYNTAAQADNGAWGQVRVLSNIFGPTFGHIPSALNVFAGITDQKPSNYKERQAVRELASRVPVLGGVRAIREGTVDAIAGEQTKRRSKSTNGWVSRNNNGWKASGW